MLDYNQITAQARKQILENIGDTKDYESIQAENEHMFRWGIYKYWIGLAAFCKADYFKDAENFRDILNEARTGKVGIPV
ncbi:hypothetical protein [Ferrovum sp.]|uniref:hypothetical protein n=1 Tax=Ferrovum sp. TaxID=2609467 RepID=UPI00261BF01B|nr:hypothetical protein [Ferrovum sp.]